jgi:tRNA pseudouridine13 synthase
LAGALRFYPEGWKAERRVLTALVAGAAPEKALKAIPRRERVLFASALQSAIFNVCLARRLDGGACDRLLSGDVLFSHRSGKARRVGDPGKEAAALARFDVSPAGPLVGEKMLEARGEPGEMEADVLRVLGLDRGALNKGLARMGVRGGRRPYRARLRAEGVLAEGGDLCLRFELPSGAYATEVLREVMKVESPRRARYYLRETNLRETPGRESPRRIDDGGA